MKSIHLSFSVVCLALTCSASFAQVDDFESYSLGNIDGQGPWIDFGGEMANEVSSDFAFSGTQSLKQTIGPVQGNPVVAGYGSDLYMDLASPLTTGQWKFSYQIYVPTSFDGAAILFGSEGSIEEGDFDVGMYLVADGTADFNEFLYSIDGGTPSTTPHSLVRDEWVEVNSLIDLDANSVDVFYAGNILYSGTWDPQNSTQPSDNDEVSIGGLNFWVQGGNGGSVYYDDINLSAVPEPSGTTLLYLGLIGLFVRLRR